MYADTKRYREAIKAYREVRILGDAPDEIKAEATYRCGLCYHAIQYSDSARMCMEEVAKRYPDDAWARKARGVLYAWEHYRTAVQ